MLTLLFAIAAVMAAMVVLPTGAGAFNVAGFTYSNSTNQANAHPDTTISFQRQGSESEDLRDIQLDLPPGVFANPESVVSKCSDAQFNSDACPSGPNGSRVGSATVDVKALGLLNLSIPGEIDILNAAPGQVATMGVTLRPDKICILFVFCAVPNKIFMKTGIQIDTFDNSQLRTYTPGSPKSSVIGIPLLFFTPTITGDITVNKMSLSFQSRGGESTSKTTCAWWGGNCKTTVTPTNGAYFFRNPNVCSEASVAKVNLVSYQNVSSAATASFNATGCDNVPYQNTTFNYIPQIQSYLAPTPVKFEMELPEADAPIQDALPQIVDTDFPIGSGINMQALSTITESCTEANLRAKNCPAGSVIGNATAISKYLPAGLTGPVYAMGGGSGVGVQVPIAVLLRGQAQGAQDQTYVIFRGTLGVRGSVEGGDGRAYARFDRIPQLPFTKFILNMQTALYVNPGTCGPQTTTGTITQFSGQTITRTSTYNNTGCPAVPETTITNWPASPWTVNPTPTFEYNATVGGQPLDDATFQCRLTKDGDTAGAYFPCDGGSWTSDPLQNGTYTFEVYAKNQTIADPTPDSKSFTLNLSDDFTITPSISPTSVQAASHPDLTATADISGGQPHDITINMPKGFNASLAVTSRCDVNDAYMGTCAASSKIGGVDLTLNSGPLGTITGHGDIFLTTAPNPTTDAGGLAIRADFADADVPGGANFIAVAGAYLTNNGNNQTIELRDFPYWLIANDGNYTFYDVTVSKLEMAFEGTNGFLTAPSQCGTDNFTTSGHAYDDQGGVGTPSAAKSVPLTTTGCGNVAFNPNLVQQFSSLAAGSTSDTLATVTVPDGNSTIKNMRVLEPQTFGPNYPAFGYAADMCSGGAASETTAFNPAGCPAQSKVGVMTLNTPLLDHPLVGTVYLVNKTPIPWFGVKFKEAGIDVSLTGYTDLVKTNPACQETNPDGSTGFCQKQISVSFLNLPDVPISSVIFALQNGSRTGSAGTLSGNMLKTADPGDSGCKANDMAKAIVDGYSGSTANLTQNITFTGC